RTRGRCPGARSHTAGSHRRCLKALMAAIGVIQSHEEGAQYFKPGLAADGDDGVGSRVRDDAYVPTVKYALKHFPQTDRVGVLQAKHFDIAMARDRGRLERRRLR